MKDSGLVSPPRKHSSSALHCYPNSSSKHRYSGSSRVKMKGENEDDELQNFPLVLLLTRTEGSCIGEMETEKERVVACAWNWNLDGMNGWYLWIVCQNVWGASDVEWCAYSVIYRRSLKRMSESMEPSRCPPSPAVSTWSGILFTAHASHLLLATCSFCSDGVCWRVNSAQLMISHLPFVISSRLQSVKSSCAVHHMLKSPSVQLSLLSFADRPLPWSLVATLYTSGRD